MGGERWEGKERDIPHGLLLLDFHHLLCLVGFRHRPSDVGVFNDHCSIIGRVKTGAQGRRVGLCRAIVALQNR